MRSRREIIESTLYISVASQLGLFSVGFAQTQQNPEILGLINEARGKSQTMLKISISDEISADAILDVEGQNTEIYELLDKGVGGLNRENQLIYVDEDRDLIDSTFGKNEVDIFPKKKEELYVKKKIEIENESLFAVVWDIVKDSFGLRAITYVKILVILKAANAITPYEEMCIAIKEGKWSKASQQLRTVLTRVLSQKGIDTIEKTLGKRALRSLLTKASSRFIPFVGWAVWIVSIILAIRNNFDRIRDAKL